MTIQWFPGHMAKALRLIQERLKYVDIVFELRDARIPYSSSNPEVDRIIQNKYRLILLNKAGKADPEKTEEWIKYYKERGIQALPIDCVNGTNMNRIVPSAKEVLKDKFERERKKGLKKRPLRALILGIPNVGKSTLINMLAKRKATKTGDRPGVTKVQQWINVENEMMLLDTPGVLWPKFEDQAVGYRLAVTGAIKDEILPLHDVAIFALRFLRENYPEELKLRYKLEHLDSDPATIIERIGRNRGCLLPGNRIDYDKVIDILLYDIRTDRLGRITWERPSDIKTDL